MKNIILIVCLLVFVNVIYAQPEVIWSRAYGGGGGDQGLAVMETADGNICVSGNESSFDGGGADGWVIMIDLEGEEIWSANHGGNGYDRFYDLIQVEDGFVTGGYTGSMGNGQFDYWLFKLDGEGNQVWSRAFGGRDFERSGTIVPTTNGGFAIVGNTLSFGAGGSDGWLVVTDEEGQEDWTMPFGGNGDDYLQGAVSLEDGGFVLAGRTTSQGEGGLDAWLFRVDNEGEEIWSHTYGGEEDDNILSMKQTNDGGYIMAGYTASFAEDGSDFWLIKTDEDGEEVWSHNYDQGTDELCREVIQTFDGGYLMGGHTWANADQRCDGLLVRTDDEGEVMWMETYGGEQPNDVITGIVQIADGGYVFTGWTASFGAGGWDAWVMRFGPEPAGVIQGFVRNAANDDPLEGATITTTNGQSAETDEEGFFIIEPAWAGDFEMTASIPGYNDSTIVDLSLEFDDTLEVDFNLLHPEFEVSQDEFGWELEENETHEFNFTAENNGNGLLEYQVEKRLLGDANVEPFELRRIDDMEEATGDGNVNGSVYVDEHFYVSGGNNGENPNKIYVLNMEREVVREFDQFVEDRNGMRDLTYDGELIWGAVNGTFYGFTTDGDLETSFEFVPENNFLGRSFAWDPDSSLLWVTDISTDIYGINREGDLIKTVENNDLRIYGLGYWPDDPDGYNLYIFCRGPNNEDIDAFKLDLESGDYQFVQFFDIDGRPSGLQITNQLDVYSWVMVALVQNPDELNIWQLAARKEWFDVDPNEGVIEAGESQDFTLTLNSTGLRFDTLYQGEAVFMHNAIQAETVISVEVSLIEGPPPGYRWINLHIGWNTVSTNIQPYDHENVKGLVSGLVENDLLIMMKNGSGDFYRPEYDYNDIGGWFSYEGYQMLMAGADVLVLRGESFLLRDDPIDLAEGWQLISYYPRIEVEATIALSGLADTLVIAKDGYGNFYLPAWDDFSNMGNMCPGNGYFINVNANSTLVYRIEAEDDEERGAALSRCISVYDAPGQLPVHAVTGENMSLLVKSDASLEGEVGVYASGELVGSGIIQDGYCGIAVWGDDESTDIDDGAKDGDELEVRLFIDGQFNNVAYTVLSGESNYETDGLAIIRLDNKTDVPYEFGIVSVYPNPFNSTTRITYSLPEAAIINLTLFDISGREVASIVNGYRKAGVYEANINAQNLSSGLYFVKLEDSKQIVTRKLMLIK